MKKSSKEKNDEEYRYICPLCKISFNIGSTTGCEKCILHNKINSCNFVKCPNCGYDFPDTTKGFTGKLMSFFNKKRLKSN